GFDSVLIGGRAQADLEAVAEVERSCRTAPAMLAGQTTIRELIALLSLAEAHVGGDTGSTHLMAALGRPAIGLYSITRPQRSCPYGQIERCLYDPQALAAIHPEAVMAKLEQALT
ncbi:MAG TPA: glycosyltransferase family 9 protein, partial [Fimbriimonadaceae bacterium]|nr:glycosyltransferase family 9 protein [Fimbriimonadaceae bacterium]